jgi:hypothetical protein
MHSRVLRHHDPFKIQIRTNHCLTSHDDDECPRARRQKHPPRRIQASPPSCMTSRISTDWIGLDWIESESEESDASQQHAENQPSPCSRKSTNLGARRVSLARRAGARAPPQGGASYAVTCPVLKYGSGAGGGEAATRQWMKKRAQCVTEACLSLAGPRLRGGAASARDQLSVGSARQPAVLSPTSPGGELFSGAVARSSCPGSLEEQDGGGKASCPKLPNLRATGAPPRRRMRRPAPALSTVDSTMLRELRMLLVEVTASLSIRRRTDGRRRGARSEHPEDVHSDWVRLRRAFSLGS